MASDSSMSTLAGALVLPFSPKSGFTAIQRHSELRTAVFAVAVLAALSMGIRFIPHLQHEDQSWTDGLATFAYGLAYSLLLYVVLVWISTVLVSGRGGKRDYSLNARVLGFWMAWLLALSTVISAALPNNFQLYTILLLFLLLWFLMLMAVALSVANYIPLRRAWLPAFCSLAVAGLVIYGLTIGAAVVSWVLT